MKLFYQDAIEWAKTHSLKNGLNYANPVERKDGITVGEAERLMMTAIIPDEVIWINVTP